MKKSTKHQIRDIIIREFKTGAGTSQFLLYDEETKTISWTWCGDNEKSIHISDLPALLDRWITERTEINTESVFLYYCPDNALITIEDPDDISEEDFEDLAIQDSNCPNLYWFKD